MARRALIIALVTSVVAASVGCNTGSSTPSRILIITIDTLRWDRLGSAGSDVETPHLDALADGGTRFTQALTVAPLTLPAHSSLFTGLYPPSHGVRANGIFRLDDELVTLAEVYSDAGFTTGAFVGSFVLDRRFGLEQGFDEYDDELPEDNPIHTAYFSERPASEVVSRATEWIRSQGDAPFFAWVHVFDPHAPYDPPPEFAARYPGRPYEGEIAYTDHALGPLLDLVTGLGDELVVVTADHGESLGEHGESTHGLYVYDSTTRIPLILNGAGVPRGERYDGIVRLVDVAPTLLELSGLPALPNLDGESLMTLLEDESAGARDAYSESFLPRYSFNWSELRALRRGSLKFIQAPSSELFDVSADADESKNLWDGPRAKEATTLASELARIARSERQAPEPVALDEETRRRLESLGYLAANVAGAEDDDVVRIDPKERIEVYEHMQELLSPDLSPEASIAGHRAILEAEPTNTLARNRLANTLSEQGRFAEAIEEYRRLVRDSEIDFKGLENLSAALLLERRTEEALSATEMAIATAPWNPDFQVLRGEALELAGRDDEARDAYGAAVDAAPSAQNLWRLGAVQEKLGSTDEAEASYRRANALEPGYEPSVAALVRILSKSDRVEDAYALVAASPDADPASAEMATAIAEAHLAAGRMTEAKELLQIARQDHPDNTRVLALLGPIYGEEGDLGRATEAMEHALSLGETSPDLRRNLAVLYLRLGRVPDAVAQLEAAVELARDDAPIWFSLGNAYFRAGAVAESVDAFERAVSLRDPWPEATFNLGMAAQRIGRNDVAIRAFRRFLEVAPASDARRRQEAERQLGRLAGG